MNVFVKVYAALPNAKKQGFIEDYQKMKKNPQGLYNNYSDSVINTSGTKSKTNFNYLFRH